MSLLDMRRRALSREQGRLVTIQMDIAEVGGKLAKKQKAIRGVKTQSRLSTVSRQVQTLMTRRARLEDKLGKQQRKVASLSAKVRTGEIEELKKMASSHAGALSAIGDLSGRLSAVEQALLDQVRDAVAADHVEREFHVFLSHAGPDKEEATEFYEALTSFDLQVWFDGAELELGRSLTLQIDEGIARSKIGVILVTDEYVKGRTWTRREAGALISTDRRVIPVLSGVDRDDLAGYSPLLNDLVGLCTDEEDFEGIASHIANTLESAMDKEQREQDEAGSLE